MLSTNPIAECLKLHCLKKRLGYRADFYYVAEHS